MMILDSTVKLNGIYLISKELLKYNKFIKGL